MTINIALPFLTGARKSPWFISPPPSPPSRWLSVKRVKGSRFYVSLHVSSHDFHISSRQRQKPVFVFRLIYAIDDNARTSTRIYTPRDKYREKRDHHRPINPVRIYNSKIENGFAPTQV